MAENSFDLKVISVNVRGLNDTKKRRVIFNWIKKQKNGVIFLQETYSSVPIECNWRSEWGSDVYFSHGSTHSRGVAIMLTKSSKLDIENHHSSSDGRILILKAKQDDKYLYLVNIYAPNTEKAQIEFFKQLSREMEKFRITPDDRVIVGGDFNVTLERIDKQGGNVNPKQGTISEIQRLMNLFDLQDIWRVRNPSEKRYTWRQKHPTIHCRLDYFFTSNKLHDSINNAAIIPTVKTDHSAITIQLEEVLTERHGKGYWKFNASLIADPEYTNNLKLNINNWKGEAIGIDGRGTWEYIKYKVRDFTISYTKNKAKLKREREQMLEHKLKLLEQNLQDDFVEYENVKSELEALLTEKAKGCIIRAKVRWHDEGETNSRYFFGLEKRNNDNKCVKKLQLEDGSIITKQEDILKTERDYYKKLYTSKNLDPNNPLVDTFLGNSDLPKLGEAEQTICEGLVTEQECRNALKTFQNFKSPGNDGLTPEFYKYFWPAISSTLVTAYNEAYNEGSLATSQRQAVITLLDKNKNRLLLKNWRPISLLNTDFKILSKTIANRLVKVIPSIIHSNQTGYIKGRTISDNIRTVYDVMKITQQKDIPGILACVDFEKAFDSIEWNYLIKTLETFNFGQSFISWIKTFYSRVEACIINNGISSQYFELERGVRQGDPISSYLFILALEPFAQAVESNKDIKGIKIGNTEVKALYFADDTTGILANQKSLEHFLALLAKFEEVSGLRVNIDKTEAKWLGSLRHSRRQPCGIMWQEGPIKLLGIVLSYNDQEMIELNYSPKVKAIRNTLNMWRQRKLTISGKITLAKSLAYSKLYYTASVLSIPQDVITEIQKLVDSFLWNGKKAKVKHSVLCASYENGGQNMVDLNSMINAQKVMLVKRYFESEYHVWKDGIDVLLEKYGGGNILFRSDYDVKHLGNDIPLFHREVLQIWSKIPKENRSNFIWNNSKIQVNGKSIFYEHFFRSGMWYINDLFDNNETISFDVWKQRGLTDRDYLRWRAIVQQCIPLNRLNINRWGENDINIGHEDAYTVLRHVTAKKLYTILVSEIVCNQSNAQRLYSEQYNISENQWKSIYVIPGKCTMDKGLRQQQYKVAQRYVCLNPLLLKMGVKETDRCTFCKEEKETISHLFVNCNKIKNFWTHFQNWWIQETNKNIQLDEVHTIFGFWEHDTYVDLLNVLLLIAKKYIYECRCSDNVPHFQAYLQKVKAYSEIEKASARKKDRYLNFLQKWEIILQSLI